MRFPGIPHPTAQLRPGNMPQSIQFIPLSDNTSGEGTYDQESGLFFKSAGALG
jgi:hypothetical protein